MSKKHKISEEEGQRWFIWTLVIIFVSLGGLALYIYNISEADNASVPMVMLNYQSQMRKSLETADLVGTTWVSTTNSGKTSISFQKTKNNDPQHQAYDYRIAVGTKVQEVGYWTDSGGNIQPIVTRVPGTPQNIQRMYASQGLMFTYPATSNQPVKFIPFGSSASSTAKSLK